MKTAHTCPVATAYGTLDWGLEDEEDPQIAANARVLAQNRAVLAQNQAIVARNQQARNARVAAQSSRMVFVSSSSSS